MSVTRPSTTVIVAIGPVGPALYPFPGPVYPVGPVTVESAPEGPV